MEKLVEIQNLLDEAVDDAGKFHNKGTKAAGVRARVKLVKVQKLIKEAREELLAKLKG
jgi:hypothetical protein